jgi:TolB-like protein/DNA-binding winged helix-turn-helix (wHTH) protein/cytochrome c-type biogenesis protein CcmH/NrfG
MAMDTADTATDARPPRRLQIDRYVLDLDRGVLLRDAHDIVLRPKTFALLRHLAGNPGRLISKDELFAAVWPNLAVTDDVLVQGIGELRRALGEDGPRLIRTIPRRGYRLDATVSPAMPPQEASRVEPTPQVAPGRPSVWTRRTWAALAALTLVAVSAMAVFWMVSGDHTARRLAGAPIAVLPFGDQDDDPARGYFADGMTQDIISGLGRFSALTVMSWNAVRPYKAEPAPPNEVGRKLAVRYLVEGGVRRGPEDRVRVDARLVDAEGRVLWTGRFDEALTDLFALQDKITTQIVGALAIRVTDSEQKRAFAKPTDSLEAHDYVLRARPALQRPTRGGLAEARTLLRRAIELDPKYAAAHSALAETYLLSVAMGWAEAPAAVLKQAEELAKKALAHDGNDVRARIVLGRIHIFHNDYDQARAEIDRATAINPCDAHGLAGRGNILMWRGETDAAVEALELARRVDPELNVLDRNALSLAYYLKHQYGPAIEQAEMNLRRTEAAHFSQALLAAAYAQDGRGADATRVAALVRRTDPTFDAREFGSKFLKAGDLEHLREGLRKAGLYTAEPPPAKR